MNRETFGTVLAACVALCTPHAAQAQCYQFASGTAASLTLNITNLPPSMTSDGNYIYNLQALSGNTATVTLGSSVYSLTPPYGGFEIAISPAPGLTMATVAVGGLVGSTIVVATVSLVEIGSDILPTGWPPVIPALAEWNTTATVQVITSATIGTMIYGPYNLTAITGSCSPPPPDKTLGYCPQCSAASGDTSHPGQPTAAEPITISTGNLFEQKNDYTTAGQNPLYFTRYYNSMASANGSFAGTMGNWRTPFDRYLHISPASSPTSVIAERADGQMLAFTLSGSTWTPDSDVDITLTHSGSTWTLTDHNDTVESYSDSGTGEGLLSTIALRNGYTQTMNYSSGLLHTVTDSYSRTLGPFTYTSGLLTNMETPDSSTGITYAYNANGALTTVTYPTSTATTLTYLYENASLPFGLTGITDENGNRYATWGYNSAGQATSNYMGGSGLSANSTTLSYSSGATTVTNAFGVVDTYTFTTYQGVPKVTGISRASTNTTAAATESFTYDSNGYLATATDWNGNATTYTNNSHGQPTTIVEAYGSSVARTTTIAYDSTWVHLPDSITTTGLTTSFTYQSGTGNVLTRTETDTTTNSTPYSTNGTARTWTNTWGTGSSIGLLLTVTGPRTDLMQETQFGYTEGALTTITDALGHVTTINATTAGGLPTKITDPNGVVTNPITYDGRQRILSSTLITAGGNLTTTWTYDNAGNLTQVTLPDSSYLSYTYDNAHRVTTITNALGEYISYMLDYLGDRMASNTYNSSATLKRQHSATFDALGRILTDVGGVSGETTTYTYDPNGNAKSIQDPRGHTQTQYFDALNRRYQVIDRASGTTTTMYDAHDRVTSVTDPNGNATTSTRDGFGRVTQQVSPDSGTSVYSYDLAGNLTQKTDGAGVVTNRALDALNRELTRSFPGNPAENVTKTYDGTAGHGFGIGRLTTMTDAAGIISYAYDERGNDTYESRNYGGVVTTMATAYDSAGRISGIVNPSGWMEAWFRDAMGQVTEVAIEAPGSGTFVPVAGSGPTPITHLPFGPVASMSFANGIARTTTYDPDYRLTNLTDSGTATVQNLTYGYDANNNVTGITDAVNAANSQTLGPYDNLDRLKGANSGAGGYGSLSWTYDGNGNRQTEINNGTTSTYGYTSNTNILTSVSADSYTFGYNGAGANTTVTQSGSPALTFGASQQEQLASVTASGTPPMTVATYTYDGNQDRALKSATVATAFKFGQAGQLLEENNTVGQTTDYVYLDPSSPVDAFYPVAMIGLTTSGGTTTETTYYMHADRIGTPQYVTDDSQTVQWTATYLPFGETGTITGSITQNLRLPGQYYDSETGLYNNGARTFSPITGRYVQSDPIGLASGTTNSYAYANNNPFRWTDTRGLAAVPTIYRYTGPGETYYRYESGDPLYSRITPYGQLQPNTFAAAPNESGDPALTSQLNDYYNLPNPDIPRTQSFCVQPPEGTLIVGPRPVAGGTGSEVLFPAGTPSNTVVEPPTVVPTDIPTYGGGGVGGGTPNIFDPFDPTVRVRPGGGREVE